MNQPRRVDTSLNYTMTQEHTNELEIQRILSNNQEMMEFVIQSKKMNQLFVTQFQLIFKEKEELKSYIEELSCQLQEKCDYIQKQDIIIQECEIQLDSWREKYHTLESQWEVQTTINGMIDQICRVEEQKLKSSQKQRITGYSTGTSLLQTSFNQRIHNMQHTNQDSLFRDSYTIESMNQTEAEQSMQNSILERRQSIGSRQNKQVLKNYLKNENLDPQLIKQKELVKKEINQWQEEFVKKEGRPPNIADKQMISQKFYQYTVLKRQLNEKSFDHGQKNAGNQVNFDSLLQNQLKQKSTEIRKLNQLIEEYKGKIKVFCRIKPFNTKLDTEIESVDDTHLQIRQKSYQFDACFGPTITTGEIYEEMQQSVLNIFQGYNLCIFAYGQTGSGKTFTMQGNKSQQGIVPLLIDDIFLHLQAKKIDAQILVNSIEIYKEQIYDLFDSYENQKHLDIKEDYQGNPYIPNVTNIKIQSSGEFHKIIDYAIQRRRQSSTELNDKSSRSHMVVTITLEQFNKNNQQVKFINNCQKLISKISLIDLAGSERCSKSKLKPTQIDEAKSINKSLSALSDVIMALSNKNTFIPYRNSKLTFLMKDCLGGNAKTIMIINISPSSNHTEETITSLQYGQRVKNIVNTAIKNTESIEIAKLKSINRQLQEENAQLKMHIQ